MLSLFANALERIQRSIIRWSTDVKDLGISAPVAVLSAFPNPFKNTVTFRYKLNIAGAVKIDVMDINGRMVGSVSENKQTGEHSTTWNGTGLTAGSYFARLSMNGRQLNTVKLIKID
ncbi:MAG: T9SS type A sorting domain-containing protein [Sphingobacteriales bacterium]|nr:MAG: T9SS type A sorting domain-containing protein [Sphingobacteriales bacterium]